ncbi:hypothetical protein HJC23_013852 [Cyclotella cryptica]|uniref:ShKT domain-containing protein n=1 Tax=Cyclotella cryptica TaxID=29204 RepID=A0ABD3P9W1_9STRA
MKRKHTLITPGLQLAIVSLLIALCQFSFGFVHCQLLVAADENSDVPAAVCGADDPRQECVNPDGSFAENEHDEDEEDENEEEGYYDEDDDDSECIDTHELCRAWSGSGECEENPAFMLKHCKRSCNVCDMKQDIKKFGEPQLIPGHRSLEVKDTISQSIIYMQKVTADQKYIHILRECRNKHVRCSEWALNDECDKNPAYMKQNCAPACKSCDYVLEMHEKCKLVPDSSLDAIQPGGMNQLFERMVRASAQMGFDPKVWSRPLKRYDGDVSSCETDITNPCNTFDGPWVITMENFVSDDEIRILLDWGSRMTYERSQAGDMVTDTRTSSHSWCTDECYHDPNVAIIRQRIADVTGIPYANYECLQLLKYEVGQFYKAHDDHITEHNQQSHGPRLLTFFIYFNEVAKGGGTQFPKLNNMTITPKKGRVLVWPSIVDDVNWSTENRTTHEALEVEQGRKFAANAWIHMRDFQAPFSIGCAG